MNARVVELYEKGDYVAATKQAERAVKAAERLFGKDAERTAATVSSLAELHIAQRHYVDAEPLLRRVLASCEKAIGPDHPDTAEHLNRLAMLSIHQGHYAEAERLLSRVLKICDTSLGTEHPNTAECLNNLAIVYLSEGRYAKAEPVSCRALAICEKTLGPEDPRLATCLGSLAGVYTRQARYDEAEPLYKRALAIREKSSGPDHPDTALSLDNLAAFYEAQGKYAQAEQLRVRSLAICEKALGPDDPDTACSLHGIAELYRFQGQYAQAEQSHARALAIREKSLGPDHQETAASLHGLAGACDLQGRHERAESLYKRAIEIREKTLGTDHPDTAASLNNLASLYYSRGMHAESEALLRGVLETLEKTLGTDHPDTATVVNNLAGLCEEQGRFEQAEPLYARALAIREKHLGPDHPDTTLSLDCLACMQAAVGRWDTAARLCDRARRGTRRHVARVLPSLAAVEQLAFLRSQYIMPFHGALTLGLLRKADPEIVSLSAGWLANGKAVAQEAMSQQILLARESTDHATAAAVADLKRVRAALATLCQMTPSSAEVAAYRKAMESHRTEEQRLIHRIGGQLAALDRGEPWVEVDAIRKNIPAGSVFVDVARFNVFDFKAKGGDAQSQRARYVAWIIPPAGRGDVRILDLGDASEIDTAVASYRAAIQDSRRSVVNGGRFDAENAVKTTAAPLTTLVLQPIVAAIGNASEILISPDGTLWLVPWQAVPLADGSYSIERFSIRTVTSGRELVPPPSLATNIAESTGAYVMADPDFDALPEEPASPVDEAAAVEQSPYGGDGVFEPVMPLPATREEAESARGPLRSITGKEPIIRLGRQAAEGILKRQAVRPRVLVLATHGFFLPDQQSSADTREVLVAKRAITMTRRPNEPPLPMENPLLRCGLFLAGANLATDARKSRDDGILTGTEVVGLDLLGTDLVVLSACETGVGTVQNGEGVAGLRQAFQIAGAKSVVATLWQVPDAESTVIMTAFYANLAKGYPAAQALREAQLAFIKARREDRNDGPPPPYLWAAYGVTGR